MLFEQILFSDIRSEFINLKGGNLAVRKRVLVVILTVCFLLSLSGLAFASDLVSDVVGTTTGLVGGVTGLVSPVVSTATGLVGSTVNTATGLVGNAASLPGQVLQVVPLPAVSDLAGDVVGVVPQTVGAVNNLTGAVLNTASGVINATAGLAGQALNATGDLVGKTLGTVGNLVGDLLGSSKVAGTVQLPAELPQTGADVLPFQLAGIVLVGLGIYLKKFF